MRMFLTLILLMSLTILTPSGVCAAGREPVLKQVDVIHTYYWRELYVPQLTQGPSALAWTPDGKSLVYSSRGRLWRQDVNTATATQLTTGGGYDYEPDVSPDARSVVFSHYENDAIELRLLDLRSGEVTALADNGAVNVDARWSPDGDKIAFVTTAQSGRFHIAIAEQRANGWMVSRWLPERTSETSRYYYSAVDHELSPSWSPDGSELVYVANPEIVHGSGSLFRRKLDLSSPAELVRAEETNWKTRPDWSPHGKRIAYSSYLGRQSHQLWMTTAAPGGYPAPFTYGDDEITGARWSPDGAKIAYISNANGDGAIIIQDVVGGARHKLSAQTFNYAQPMARLSFTVHGADGAPSPARISVVASDGRNYAPPEALIHADDGFDRNVQSFETHYFHTDGPGEIMLPPGEATVTVWRGLESAVAMRTVNVAKSGAEIDIALSPLDDSDRFDGWVSADPHVHMNYGGHYRVTPAQLREQAAGEDLDMIFNLIVNKDQRIPDIGYFTPAPP